MRSCSFVSFRCLDPPLSCLVLFLPGPFSSGRGTRDEGPGPRFLASSLPRCLAPRSLQVGEAARQRGAHQKSLGGKFPNSNQALPQNPKCNRTERGRGEKASKVPWCMHFSVLPGRPGQTRLGGEIFILFIYFRFISFSCFPFISLSISLCLLSLVSFFLSFHFFLMSPPAPARPCPALCVCFSFIIHNSGACPGSLAPRMCICPVSRDKWHPLIGPQHHL